MGFTKCGVMQSWKHYSPFSLHSGSQWFNVYILQTLAASKMFNFYTHIDNLYLRKNLYIFFFYCPKKRAEKGPDLIKIAIFFFYIYIPCSEIDL